MTLIWKERIMEIPSNNYILHFRLPNIKNNYIIIKNRWNLICLSSCVDYLFGFENEEIPMNVRDQMLKKKNYLLWFIHISQTFIAAI